MAYKITLIPGDGIGPEVSGAAQACVDAIARRFGFGVDWEEMPAGEEAEKKHGSVLPKKTLASIRKNTVALKGPITTPVGSGFRSVNVELRQKLDLFANVRPAKLLPGVESKYSGVDLVVIRENTEDLYAGIEFDEGKKATIDLISFAKKNTGKTIRKDSAISLKPISVFGSRRIAKFAFDYAKANRRKKVTAVHKANIMKYSDGLFLKTVQAVAKKYPSITFEDRIVDNMCMQLVIKPELYDVLVCPNLYGDIVSDLCSGLVGGLGIAPSANIGEKYAVFEPIHGSAPKHAGKDEANPTACILSAAMMLGHIGENKAAVALEEAVVEVIKEGKKVTYDLNPRRHVGTKAMTEEIIRKIGESA
ncbi:MAG: isocitrate/isopropylmalate dehydrogenase family protein [Candidatus Micrarchaeales archaeon]|nr:isocitrate/isopropylmalate dehydrogenase family protein [Candidatus Micrarchaeales archaeon]